jgi:hypothetical protein
MKEITYTRERDKSIADYLQRLAGTDDVTRETWAAAFFQGFETYQELWNDGYLLPGFSHLRIMYNHARYDEHYWICEGGLLEGADLPAHAGKPGIHKPQDILIDGVPEFEIGRPNPSPRPLPLEQRI